MGGESARLELELELVVVVGVGDGGAGAAAGGEVVRRGAWLPQPASAIATRVTTSSAHFMIGEVR